LARKKGYKASAAEKARARAHFGTATPDRLAKYLEFYSAGWSSGQAAKKVGLSLTAISYHKRQNPEFAERWQVAYDEFTGFLESKAEGMAREADRYSPTMLIFLLKARKPHVYRDNVSMHHSGSVEFAGTFAAAMDQVTRGSQPSATQH
jgi:hypothetical protein